MVAPQPFKYKCPKCNYSKIIKPKSDVLNPIDFIDICPKCGSKMNPVNLSIIDKFFNF
jgi:DNA-directed RNA polymerase subunit RPC12/RpoP